MSPLLLLHDDVSPLVLFDLPKVNVLSLLDNSLPLFYFADFDRDGLLGFDNLIFFPELQKQFVALPIHQFPLLPLAPLFLHPLFDGFALLLFGPGFFLPPPVAQLFLFLLDGKQVLLVVFPPSLLKVLLLLLELLDQIFGLPSGLLLLHLFFAAPEVDILSRLSLDYGNLFIDLLELLQNALLLPLYGLQVTPISRVALLVGLLLFVGLLVVGVDLVILLDEWVSLGDVVGLDNVYL